MMYNRQIRITKCLIVILAVFAVALVALELTRVTKPPMFEESTLPLSINTEALKGSVIIYYAETCSDCKAVAKDLKDAVANVENLYFVNTKTKQGQMLLDIFPVQYVPAAVYVQHNDNIPFIQKVIYMHDEKEQSILDMENLKYILNLQTEQK